MHIHYLASHSSKDLLYLCSGGHFGHESFGLAQFHVVFLFYDGLERAGLLEPKIKLQLETPKAEPGNTLRTELDG
jgi:hypothetical protein